MELLTSPRGANWSDVDGGDDDDGQNGAAVVGLGCLVVTIE